MEHKHSPAPSDDGLSLGSSPAVSRSPSPEVGRRAQSPSPELSAALRATAPPKKVVVAAPPPKKVVPVEGPHRRGRERGADAAAVLGGLAAEQLRERHE